VIGSPHYGVGPTAAGLRICEPCAEAGLKPWPVPWWGQVGQHPTGSPPDVQSRNTPNATTVVKQAANAERTCSCTYRSARDRRR
jgi:hypothetical protein